MIYFISDIHLGASYIKDPRQQERHVVDFLNSIADKASHLYMLGDVLDYWYEYRNVVPRGYVRFFGALASLADKGVKITWLTGNHDIWLFDYLRDELGIEVVDAPYIVRDIAGSEFILAHGDRIGRQIRSFRLICTLFRSKLCQRLYSAIHPRWTVPFAHRWSSGSRKSHAEMTSRDFMDKVVMNALPTFDEVPNARYMIMGHHHRAFDATFAPNRRMIILGDCIDKVSYGEFDGKTFALKIFNQEQ